MFNVRGSCRCLTTTAFTVCDSALSAEQQPSFSSVIVTYLSLLWQVCVVVPYLFLCVPFVRGLRVKREMYTLLLVHVPL